MALVNTSDDSLARILHYLTVSDLSRLMVTGSKRFISRIVQNTVELDWHFKRPTFFPSSCFSFLKLRSLSIKATGEETTCGYLSILERMLLPLEPMPALESLSYSFQHSHLIFEQPLSRKDLSLASCFPKLTCLSISSYVTAPLASGWAESLPHTLISLKLDVSLSEDCPIPPSAFESLPQGLQRIELGQETFVGPGALNFGRFTNLRVLTLLKLLGWNVLESSLPESLEELDIYVEQLAYGAKECIFPVSKLPPRLRVFSIIGPDVEIVFDYAAPSTLERLYLPYSGRYSEPGTMQDLLPFKNLRSVGVWGREGVAVSHLPLFPNLETVDTLYLNDLPSLQVLPRKLKSLSLRGNSGSPHFPVNQLPPNLKELESYVLYAEDVTDLPKTLISLKLFPLRDAVPPLSASVWNTLSPSLTSLDIELNFFESESCFNALPETLEKLFLRLPSGVELSRCMGMMERLKFPSSMLKSLLHLTLTFYQTEGTGAMKNLIPKLADFSRLERFSMDAKIPLKHDTLSLLPKTLINLCLLCDLLENFGLPIGEDKNFQKGAFSSLPEGLEELSLSFYIPPTHGIDFRLFYYLPKRLATLHLFTAQNYCDNARQFVAALPKRLEMLNCHYLEPSLEDLSDEEAEATYVDHDEKQTSLETAIDEYYNAPFWDGFVRPW